MMSKNAKDVWEGIKDGLVLFPLYLPLSVTFAILAKSMGVNPVETVIWSAMSFAGAAQIACLSIMKVGGGYYEIIVITTMITLRQLFIGIGISGFLTDIRKKWLPLFCFCVATSSIGLIPARAAKGGSIRVYGFSVQLCQYAQWVIFTWVGTLISYVHIPTVWNRVILFCVPSAYMGLMIPIILLAPRSGIVVSISAGLSSLVLLIFLEGKIALILAALIGAGLGLIVKENI